VKTKHSSPSSFIEPRSGVAFRHGVAPLPQRDEDLFVLSLLPPVSGEECARVLELTGCTRLPRGRDTLWLDSGGVPIAVPSCDVIQGDALVSILRAARVTVPEFVELLGALSIGRVPVAKQG
jgi:hypothetical protein